MRIDCKTYLETDEIDHITIRCRKGEKLDRKAAIKLIKYHAACSEPVARALTGVDVTAAALQQCTDERLYDLLILTRTALIDTVL